MLEEKNYMGLGFSCVTNNNLLRLLASFEGHRHMSSDTAVAKCFL